jgi:hypothetical protein
MREFRVPALSGVVCAIMYESTAPAPAAAEAVMPHAIGIIDVVAGLNVCTLLTICSPYFFLLLL